MQLTEALQSLPPSVAEAISRHVSCTHEALQKAESERRAMARSLSAAHSQLAVLPQLQVCTSRATSVCRVCVCVHAGRLVSSQALLSTCMSIIMVTQKRIR